MSEHDLHKGGREDCQIVEELLSPFIDEELNATADAFVRRHLDSCKGCMKRLDELKATVVAINGLPTEATPEHDLWPGIVAASSDGSLGVPLGASEKRRWRMPKPMLLAAGLAALLAPAGVFAGMSLMRDNHESLAVPRPDHVEGLNVDMGDLEISIEGIEEWAEAFAQEWESAAEEWADQWDESYDRGGYDELELDALLSALQDEDPDIRATVARTLGDYENPRVVMALSQALQDDSDDEVRRWAAWALGEIGDSRAIPALSQCLMRDPYPEARRWAAWSLGEIGDSRGVEALSATLINDSYDEARRWAAWALGEIGDSKGVAALSRAVENDSHGETRRWAAWALGEIGSPQAVRGLSQALLNDSNWEVRRWSAWALGEIEDASAAEALSEALRNDENAEVRRWAIWALGELERR
jgi:HEAT repeat protein